MATPRLGRLPAPGQPDLTPTGPVARTRGPRRVLPGQAEQPTHPALARDRAGQAPSSPYGV
ncbi:hypothetical protein ABZZ80_17545 [Streptomyces sp. NPDC006356]